MQGKERKKKKFLTTLLTEGAKRFCNHSRGINQANWAKCEFIFFMPYLCLYYMYKTCTVVVVVVVVGVCVCVCVCAGNVSKE